MVGATGVFGQRLVTGILAAATFDVVVAARDTVRLAALVERCNRTDRTSGRTRVTLHRLDLHDVTPDALERTDAFAVVDAAGLSSTATTD